MIYLILAFLSTLSLCATSTQRSIFGHPGVDEVEHEFIDGFEILQTGLPKPQLKSLYNKGFTKEKIEPDDYPWPGHAFNRTCTRDKMIEEYENLKTIYNRSDVKQNEVYWHPAASKTYHTTDEELAKADRVKVRFVMQATYTRHVLPAFLPPGELITIEIPEGVTLNLILNRQCIPMNAGATSDQRLYSVRFDIKLNKSVSTIASPFGGTLLFECSNRLYPIEINVTGVILQPYFFYGMTSDEEWENELSKLPGPYTYIDTGNVVHIVPSAFVRSETRMNDAMHWWRSALQISQTTARDNARYGNERFGRVTNPCIMLYDNYIAYGAAYAMVGANYCVLPCGWIHNVVRYNNAVNNPWGNIHEMDHHHQENWAKTHNAGEMSNNAVNLVVFAKTSMCSSYRSTSGWARFAYSSYELNDQLSDQLPRLSNLLHFFGVNKFKEFVKTDQENQVYPRDQYGNAGSEMLKASKVFNRNLRYHWNFHGNNDSVLTKVAIDEVNKLNLKPFHPVTNIYAVGHIVDDVAFITARPYRIFPFEQTIDFVSTITQRSNKEQFGDFVFKSVQFEEGRNNAWTEESKGVYKLKPKDDLTEIETVNVTYLDKTTGEDHVVICQFTTYYFNNIAYMKRVGNIPLTENDLFKAYKYYANNSSECSILTSEYINTGIASPDFTNNTVNYWISIGEGNLSIPEEGDYVFSITADYEGAFYLSDKKLSGDPDLDADYLLNYQKGTQMSFENGNKSKEVHLESNKIYYYRHIVFPNRGNRFKGRSWVGFKMLNSADDSQVTWETVPASWFIYNEVDEEEMYNAQYHPDFERIYGMDEWSDSYYAKTINQTNWSLYKYPAGGVINNSNKGQGQESQLEPIVPFVDNDPTTEYRANWWPSNKAVKFPHIYEFDMNTMNTFESIRLGPTGNKNWFAMNCYLEIYLAPYNYSTNLENESIPYASDNYSVDHNESIVFAGYFNNIEQDYIELNKTVKGRYLKLVFYNNSLNWKDNNPGRTCISSIELGIPVKSKKIYPITNTRYFEFNNRFDWYHGGCYYNGKGITGYAKGQAPKTSQRDDTNNKNSILKIKIPKLKPEIGIIGDFQPGAGRAIVKLDGREIGEIGVNSYNATDDQMKLKTASRAHKSLLFYVNGIDTNRVHTMTIEIVEGKITFAGILAYQMVVTYFTDDWRYPKMIETEFSDYPEQFDWYTPSDQIGSYVPIDHQNDKKKGLSAGAIAAIVIVVILVVAAACVGVFIMVKKELLCFKKSNGDSSSVLVENQKLI